MDNRPSTCLRVLRPVDRPRARLVCAPASGTAASAVRPLACALPADVELVAVQYPGREDRATEPFCTDTGALAAAVAAELRWREPAPLVLFGHSLGALVAHRCAALLAPWALVVAGRADPWTPRPAVHALPDAQLWAELERLGGVDAAVLHSPELQELFGPVVRADLALDHGNRPPPPGLLACPVRAFAGTADPLATPAQMRGWAAATTGTFGVTAVPGGHFFVRDRAAEVVGGLRELLP